jgi:dipeptidyl aminopeptidase/acylaminoacyl peptidase
VPLAYNEVMLKKIVILAVLLLFLGVLNYLSFFSHTSSTINSTKNVSSREITQQKPTASPTPQRNTFPLAIVTMKNKSYPGSTITIDQTLPATATYNQYVASYLSDGLKIYGLLTVPLGTKPSHGWPVILFNHGYIPPASYSTTDSYAVMVQPLAEAGYIVFKPDYRGNGNSQGTPTQPYITPDYVTDSMNALASIKKYKDADPNKIGVFGHSMGGNITLHELVMTHDIKAAELMAGVTCSATDLLQWWDHRIANHSITGNDLDTSYVVETMIKAHGTPTSNPSYWNALDPTRFISSITAPVEIQVGSADTEVPIVCSTSLDTSLQKDNKSVLFNEYTGSDHNLSPDTSVAMAEAVSFFNRYVK